VKQQSSQIVDPLTTVLKGYFNEIQQYCYRREENASLGLKFTFTPMHGVGGDAVKRAFKAFNLPEFVPVPEQVSHCRKLRCTLNCTCTFSLNGVSSLSGWVKEIC